MREAIKEFEMEAFAAIDSLQDAQNTDEAFKYRSIMKVRYSEFSEKGAVFNDEVALAARIIYFLDNYLTTGDMHVSWCAEID